MKRRKLLKWGAPLISSTALPTHAQSSFCAGGTLSIESVSVLPQSGTLRLGDTVTINMRWTAINISPEGPLVASVDFVDAGGVTRLLATALFVRAGQGELTLTEQIQGQSGSPDVVVQSGSVRLSCISDGVGAVNAEDVFTVSVDWTLTY